MIRTVQKRTVLALLVEVNGLVRLKLTRALEQEDFEVLWAATTQEAVAAYNRRHINLLLLDLNQPLKVGWDIFEPVGALNPALPIVMVTEKKTELEQTVAERWVLGWKNRSACPRSFRPSTCSWASRRKPICN
jgi:CheY-like chemotaxis protein